MSEKATGLDEYLTTMMKTVASWTFMDYHQKQNLLAEFTYHAAVKIKNWDGKEAVAPFFEKVRSNFEEESIITDVLEQRIKKES